MEFPITNRIRAARHLAGFARVEELAVAIAKMGTVRRGLSTKSLRLIEQGKEQADLWKLNEIAAACGLPLEFFVVDFSRLPELVDDPRREMAAALAEASARAEARRADMNGDTRSPREGAR